MFRFPLGPGLDLRLLEERHAEPLFELVDRSRAHLRAWMPWLDANTSVADSAAFIQTTLQQFAANNGFQAGIWLDGAIIGVIGFHSFDWLNRQTEIGYWLGAGYQGQGIMTRACKALVDYALRDQNLHRVQIRCARGNARSRAIPERLGFQQEGVQEQAEWLYDHYVDLVVYRMLATEWRVRYPEQESRPDA